MTREKQIATVKEIRRLQAEVAELRGCRKEALTGAASGTFSAGGGSKSYSNWSPEKLDAAIAKDLAEIKQLKRALAGRPALRIGFAKIRRG